MAEQFECSLAPGCQQRADMNGAINKAREMLLDAAGRACERAGRPEVFEAVLDELVKGELEAD